MIAIGEITGPYRWAPDGDPDMPHVREVTGTLPTWRVAFDPDLRYCSAAQVTVCSVTRNHAEPRVRAMIDDL
jgi:predicted Mrr-cat superfamily restriction endonuclease